MILNSSNIEKLVLFNSEILNKLPHLANEINQWKLGQINPSLRPMAQKAKLDILNKLSEEDLVIIKNILKTSSLEVEKLNYNLIKNHTSNLFKIETELNDNNFMIGEFCLYRDDNSLYICSWR